MQMSTFAFWNWQSVSILKWKKKLISGCLKKTWGLKPTDFCGWSKEENKNVLASPFSAPYLCTRAPADWGSDKVLSHVCHFHYIPGTCRISECTETNWAEFQVITLFSRHCICFIVTTFYLWEGLHWIWDKTNLLFLQCVHTYLLLHHSHNHLFGNSSQSLALL